MVNIPVCHFRRREHMQTILTPYDNRQGDTFMVIKRHLPAIAITEMLKNRLLQIRFLLFRSIFSGL